MLNYVHSPTRHLNYLLDELISSFYVFFPESKQSLKPYFRLLSRCRNPSIHLSLPSFQRYELERTAFLALQVFKILDDKHAFFWMVYDHLSKEDETFLAQYSEERTERVRHKIEEAREKAKTMKIKYVSISASSWDAYETRCPVCRCDGILTGETDVEVDTDEKGVPSPYLTFLADTFECDGCGLKLDDVEEMQRAGMDIYFVRPETDMDKWNAENEPWDYDHEEL